MFKPSVAELQETALAVTSSEETRRSTFRHLGITYKTLLLPTALVVVLLGVLYLRIAARLAADWYTFPDQSHGLLIPFFILYLIWTERSALLAGGSEPSWTGMWMVVTGLLVLLLGVFGADLFLSRFSFLLVAAGLVWTILGLEQLGRIRFILLVALLAIPLPALILNQITFPLQIYASKFATALLTLSGVPVLRDGNVLQLPAMQLEVAEACSGIRSLMSLLTVAIIFGYFMERSTKRRFILAAASIPIAIAANAMRIFGTGLCVQYWDPDKALGFFHEFSGWVMFLISLACLYMMHKMMALLVRKRELSA